MRALQLLAETTQIPEHEAFRLLQSVLGVERAGIVANPEVPAAASLAFRRLVARRVAGEPLQYLEGSVFFGPITLRTDRRALIPRPETERMWELSVALIVDLDRPLIVDLCSGSGNLALALKAEFPDAQVVGTDISVDAITLAEENAVSLDLDVDFRVGDLFEPLDAGWREEIDLIVANPPYVESGEWKALPRDVRDHEPYRALVAGPTGTEILRRIAREASDWLRPGGHLICEIGESQGNDCREFFAAFEPQIVKDLAGRDRYVVGSAPLL